MRKQVGERIEKIRKELNLSKAKFGKLLGVSGQYIGRIERGDSLSIEMIIKICNETGVSSDFILFGVIDSNNATSISAILQGLSNEQIEIAFDIIKKVTQFINTNDGNELLIREIANQ